MLATERISRSGRTAAHATAATRQRPAAVKKDADQPNWSPIQRVAIVVMKPPTWAPIFITPDTAPADGPAMSALADQKELWARYSVAAPPARTTAASRASTIVGPMPMNTAASVAAADAKRHRPIRGPKVLVRRSL